MNKSYIIHNNTVHLWRLFLPDFKEQLVSLALLLNSNEKERAERFHFPTHRDRFIITHGLLRKTLSLYTEIDPKALIFHEGAHGKPFLNADHSNLTFNISHSHDMAIFAFTSHREIGVDIEKMEFSFKESVAKRFFSSDEYIELMELPSLHRVIAFYKIWSRKEALIKLWGKGLFTPLDSFSVTSHKDSQSILFNGSYYHVNNIAFNSPYQAAFATDDPINEVIEWHWINNQPLKS